MLTLLLTVICLEIGFVLWSDTLTAHSDFPEARGWLAGLAQSIQAMEPQGVELAVTPHIRTLPSHRCHSQFS